MNILWLLILILISTNSSLAYELISFNNNYCSGHSSRIIATIAGGSAVCVLGSYACSYATKKVAHWQRLRSLRARFKSTQHMQDTYDEIILKKIAIQASQHHNDEAQLDTLDRLITHYKPNAHPETIQEFKEIAYTYAKMVWHSETLNSMVLHFLPFIIHHEKLDSVTIGQALNIHPQYAHALPDDKEDMVEFLLHKAERVVALWGAQKNILKLAVAHAIKKNQFDIKDAENYLAYNAGTQKGIQQFPIDALAIRQQQSLLGYLYPNNTTNLNHTLQEHITHLHEQYLNQEEIEFLALP